MNCFSSFEDFCTEIKQCGIPVAEAEYAKGKSAPNITFFRGEEQTIYANSEPVFKLSRIVVELYTEKTDNTSEEKFEEWLESVEITYQKNSRTWISSEKWYQTIYEFWVIFDGSCND